MRGVKIVKIDRVKCKIDRLSEEAIMILGVKNESR